MQQIRKKYCLLFSEVILLLLTFSCSSVPVHVLLKNPPGASTEESIKLIWEHAIYLCGRPEKYLSNICFDNIDAFSPLGLSGRFIDQVYLSAVKIENKIGKTIAWMNVNHVNNH